jgi:thiol:disulfide interchange protein DsbD
MTIRFKWLKWLFALAMLGMVPFAHAGLFDGLTLGKKEPAFLQPDQAFGLNVAVRDANTLTASFKVTPDYYLYRDKITFNTEDLGVKVAGLSLPKGEMKHDANFGDLEVFHESFKVAVALKRSNNAAREITLNVSYQGCSEKGLCYPPIKKQIKVALPAVPAAGAKADGGLADSVPRGGRSRGRQRK